MIVFVKGAFRKVKDTDGEMRTQRVKDFSSPVYAIDHNRLLVADEDGRLMWAFAWQTTVIDGRNKTDDIVTPEGQVIPRC